MASVFKDELVAFPSVEVEDICSLWSLPEVAQSSDKEGSGPSS